MFSLTFLVFCLYLCLYYLFVTPLKLKYFVNSLSWSICISLDFPLLWREFFFYADCLSLNSLRYFFKVKLHLWQKNQFKWCAVLIQYVFINSVQTRWKITNIFINRMRTMELLPSWIGFCNFFLGSGSDSIVILFSYTIHL